MEVDGPLQSKFDATCGVLGHRRLSRPLYYLACKSAWLVRSLCRSVPVRVPVRAGLCGGAVGRAAKVLNLHTISARRYSTANLIIHDDTSYVNI